MKLQERLPSEWNFGNCGKISNGTVHPGGMFWEKRVYLGIPFFSLSPEFPENVTFVHTYQCQALHGRMLKH